MRPMTYFYALIVGAVAGLLGALCGVGGGIFLVPMFVTFFAMSQKQGVATSLAVVIATSLASTLLNGKAGLVQWPIALAAGVGAVAAAVVGTGRMQALSDQTLRNIFGVVMIAAGLWMLLSPAKGR